jgi:ABC-type transport system substrate-binding protein
LQKGFCGHLRRRIWSSKDLSRLNNISRFLCLLITAVILSAFLCCRYKAAKNTNEKSTQYSVLTSKVRLLDPADITDNTSALVASQIYECLYQYHYLKRPYELVCQLAGSLPQVSEDGLTYTIKIKKGVCFADDACFSKGQGRTLKAADFIYAWKRIADIKNLSRNWWIFEDRIVGLDQFRQYTGQCKTAEEVDYNRLVEGLQAMDDYTLIIKLKKPWPQFMYFLARPATAPIPKEAVDFYGSDFANHPVGTGPFKLKQWNKSSFIELVKNEKFRDEFFPNDGEPDDAGKGLLVDAGKKLPLTERVVFSIVEEDQPRWFLFMQGKIDILAAPQSAAGGSQAIDPYMQLKEELKNKGISLDCFRDPSTFWLGFNMQDKLLGPNKPLRQAISFAIDRQRYIRLFYEGRSESAYGLIPPALTSYNPLIKETVGPTFDLQRAKALLKEAEKKYGGRLPQLTLTMPGTASGFRKEGDFFRHCLEEIGLDVVVEYVDWPRFQEMARAKDMQLFCAGWIGQYPDAENFLQLFYSKNIQSGLNHCSYSNVSFDKIYEQASVMFDCPQRDRLYRQAEMMIVEDCPAVFLRHGIGVILHHNWLKNVKPHSFGFGLSKYRRVDDKLRSEYQDWGETK